MIKVFPIRLDMSRPRAEGYKAFKDGMGINACIYGMTDPKRSEWLAGYGKARSGQVKLDEKIQLIGSSGIACFDGNTYQGPIRDTVRTPEVRSANQVSLQGRGDG